ncbi:MAG: hypothetical protein Q8K82_06815 [Gemmatimonadaceae bacterium]|nr:hypothetical protein [Gemmatimonadaceae bacterium]
MTKRRWAVVAGILMGVGACAGESDGETPTMTMTVIGTEMAFDAPSQVTAGEYVVTFRNDGAVAHELAFQDPSTEIVTRRSIGAGASVTMPVKLEPGEWLLGCYEPGHYDAGMHRPLTVTPA